MENLLSILAISISIITFIYTIYNDFKKTNEENKLLEFGHLTYRFKLVEKHEIGRENMSYGLIGVPKPFENPKKVFVLELFFDVINNSNKNQSIYSIEYVWKAPRFSKEMKKFKLIERDYLMLSEKFDALKKLYSTLNYTGKRLIKIEPNSVEKIIDVVMAPDFISYHIGLNFEKYKKVYEKEYGKWNEIDLSYGCPPEFSFEIVVIDTKGRKSKYLINGSVW